MGVGGIDGSSKNAVQNAQTYTTKSTDDDFERRLKAAAEKGDDSELKQVCKEFEAIFINMLYKQMRATVPKTEYLNSDSATDIYNSMLDDKLVEVAGQRGIGLGEMMYKQLSKQYSKTGSTENAAGGVIDEKK